MRAVWMDRGRARADGRVCFLPKPVRILTTRTRRGRGDSLGLKNRYRGTAGHRLCSDQ